MKHFRSTEVFDSYQEGDTIEFEMLDGEPAEAIAVKKEGDGMIFITVDCLGDEYPMNPTGSNKGGYEASYLRAKLSSEILCLFPAEIREKMIAFSNGDLLRLPTECEIFGYNPFGEDEPEDVEQWGPMGACRNCIAFQGSKTGLWEWYWLQNKAVGSAASFARVGSGGTEGCGDASGAGGVRPVFKLKGRTK